MKIEAKILAKSVSPQGVTLTTWELVYPRIIHAELMTHCMLAKNAASSRAIPVEKVLEMVRNSPAMPVRFGANQAGMQDKGGEHDGIIKIDYDDYYSASCTGREVWQMAAEEAAHYSEALHRAGYHKQVCNRLTEPFQWMKTVVTGTEWTNFYWLRDDDAADPTFRALVSVMVEEDKNTIPVALVPGNWHLPYYGNGYWGSAVEGLDGFDNTLSDAITISMSCCAQVSYRTLDDTIEKAHKVVDRLNLGKDLSVPVHASPSSHQATPMKGSMLGNWHDSVNLPPFTETWEDGVTAYHKELGLMSGNLSGWIQNRQLIKGHTKW